MKIVAFLLATLTLTLTLGHRHPVPSNVDAAKFNSLFSVEPYLADSGSSGSSSGSSGPPNSQHNHAGNGESGGAASGNGPPKSQSPDEMNTERGTGQTENQDKCEKRRVENFITSKIHHLKFII